MENDVQVVLAPDFYVMQLESVKKEIHKRDSIIHDLRVQLDYERQLRERLEERFGKLPDEPSQPKKRKRREVTPDTNAYSEFKSDGKRKAHAADAIRSYDDFSAIQKYYLEHDDIRDWTMWTVGVSLGLRVSDLLSLKFGHIIDNDKKTFKPRIMVYEQKTGKLNNALITESVVSAITTYLDSIKWTFELDGYLFPSQKTGQKMYEEHGWRILSKAGKDLGLPIHIGSHTMRKSFANIAACVDKSCIDMNAITKVQGLLNHGDQRVTMRYLGTYQEMFDRARVAVSDFVLGKSGVNEIIAGNQYTIDDIVKRFDALEEILTDKGTDE